MSLYDEHSGDPAPPSAESSPDWDDALRRISRREYALTTLMELSRTFSASLDLYEQVDSLLFGLMGQLGTSRSAIWVTSTETGTTPILMRCHGFRRPLMLSFGSTLAGRLSQVLGAGRFAKADDLDRDLEDDERLISRETGVAVVVGIPSPTGSIGAVVMGRPLGRERYDAGDLQLLETGVGLIGMALVNARLHGELAESNRVLRQTNDAMRELDRIKSEFIANVNHELRTPLTIISAALEVLQEPGELTGRSSEMAGMAASSCRRLQGLVENLLAFSSLSRDVGTGTTEPIDLHQMIHNFHRARRPGVNSGLREFVLVCEDSLPPVHADAQALDRILGELVDNAVKSTPSGTRIEIDVKRSIGDRGDWVTLAVRDNGPGMPKENLRSIFREFEHGGASHPDRHGGIGIGLPLAQQLATRMGGHLDIETNPGEGTCVTLRLAAVERRRASREESPRLAA